MSWLEAFNSATGKVERITVMQSLKTVWQIAPARVGGGKDILEARCRPGTGPAGKGSEPNFTLTYLRYAFNGKQWVRSVRERKGYSDFEAGFPDRKLFP
jgi:hypothetical protein